jgi:hypothetical protein
MVCVEDIWQPFGHVLGGDFVGKILNATPVHFSKL